MFFKLEKAIDKCLTSALERHERKPITGEELITLLNSACRDIGLTKEQTDKLIDSVLKNWQQQGTNYETFY